MQPFDTRIDPSLISNVHRPIFPQQNLSSRIELLDRRLFRIEAAGFALSVLAMILGLIFAALKIDSVETFLGLT
jgi:hypothetical protein